ncbi:hypothetical protein [Paenibacillus sp. XY044]|uniref:hypothetical protein n=1 Tax=Paenibacillus sp. XY044 TaxID=2026089 RepID=UPI000B989677|nr:hypothetical protein [Paenibacillus sp. XY044]OZB98104.1 hypothetical protein CJP46_02750 [Paenibacillus sp. XY044]
MLKQLHSLREGVSNLIRWFPIIWRDRDWDQENLYKIVHKKLEHMEDFFRSENTHIKAAKEVADEIREAKVLLANKINTAHTNKVDYDTDEFISLKNNEFNVDRENKNYKAWMKEMSAAEEQESKDMKAAFEIIGNKSESWWD